MNKYEDKILWKPFSIFCESPTRMQIQRRLIVFHALDPDNISMRFSLMLNDALGNSYVHNPFNKV